MLIQLVYMVTLTIVLYSKSCHTKPYDLSADVMFYSNPHYVHPLIYYLENQNEQENEPDLPYMYYGDGFQMPDKRHETRETIKTDYRTPCDIEVQKVHLNETGFEYDPKQYLEIKCKGRNNNTNREVHDCECRQSFAYITIVKRKETDDCWQRHVTQKEIPFGCHCSVKTRYYG